MDDQKKIASKFGIHQSLLEAVRGVMTPVQESKGEPDPVMQGSSDEHACASKIAHEEWGVGTPIFAEHAEPDRHGNVAWYDVEFDHGVEKRVPVAEMRVLEEKNHGNHKKMKESAGSRPQDKTGGETNPVDQGSSKEHMCAKQIAHEEYGVGKPIFGQHAEPDRYGNVAWYDVMFDHGVEERLPVTEMKVVASESHMNHKKK